MLYITPSENKDDSVSLSVTVHKKHQNWKIIFNNLCTISFTFHNFYSSGKNPVFFSTEDCPPSSFLHESLIRDEVTPKSFHFFYTLGG